MTFFSNAHATWAWINFPSLSALIFFPKSIRKTNEGFLFRLRDFLSTLMKIFDVCVPFPNKRDGTEVTRIQPSKTLFTTSVASTLPKSDRDAVLVALKIMSGKEKSLQSGQEGLLVLKSPSFFKAQMWTLRHLRFQSRRVRSLCQRWHQGAVILCRMVPTWCFYPLPWSSFPGEKSYGYCYVPNSISREG